MYPIRELLESLLFHQLGIENTSRPTHSPFPIGLLLWTQQVYLGSLLVVSQVPMSQPLDLPILTIFSLQF